MRILIDGIPRSMGGIGTLIVNIVHYNESQGNRNSIEFEFLVPLHSEYINLLKSEGYVYYEVPRVLTREYRKTIRSIFSQKKFDYVWINNTSKVNIDLPRIAKKSGAAVIVHSHGVSTEAKGLKRLVFSMIEKINTRAYCKLIDIPLACSKASAEFFYPADLLEKCSVVSNGIEAEKFLFNEAERERIRNELGIKNDEILIGAVGRLTAVKNYVFIADLLPQLPSNCKVILLGDGEDKEYLKTVIENNGIGDRFFMLGKKQDIPSYLSAMDIFVMPSLNEGMPFSLIEAQANGLKCIVSTGVTREAKIIDCVSFISLDDRQAWKNEIMGGGLDYKSRIEACMKIGKAGFDIKNCYLTFIESIKKCFLE